MMDDCAAPGADDDPFRIETGLEEESYDSRFLTAVLLVYVAKADGDITADESSRMLELLGDRYHLKSAESLELLHRAMTDIARNPDLDSLLQDLGTRLNDDDREDLALMMVAVLAADGKADAVEMERMREAGSLVGIRARTIHDAFDRYHAETRPDV